MSEERVGVMNTADVVNAAGDVVVLSDQELEMLGPEGDDPGERGDMGVAGADGACGGPQHPPAIAGPNAPSVPTGTMGAMAVGEIRFGVTASGEPIGRTHWLADSAVCGDLVMALPSSVLVAGRTREAGGVAVDMALFLDAIFEGVPKLTGIAGIAESAGLPMWAVNRLMGTFPALMQVYNEAMDQQPLLVEAAAMRAAMGMTVTHKRTLAKEKTCGLETHRESSTETIEKNIPPDPTLSKLILTSRMKGRYKDEGGNRQAVQIVINAAEANL